MKVVGYVRVSTDRQAEDGLGLEVQEQAIRKWCRENKHRLVGVLRDEGISGSNGLDTRVGLADALAAIQTQQARGIIVYRLDRLARDQILQEQLLQAIRRQGGDLFSTVPSEQDFLVDDPEDPSRKLIRTILAAINEYEGTLIGLRLRAGRRMKAEKGGYAGGAPPYGWKAEGRELVPVPEEQEVIHFIVDSFTSDEMSLRQIVAALEAEGLAPRSGRRHPTNVSRILRRAGVDPKRPDDAPGSEPKPKTTKRSGKTARRGE